MPDRFFARRCAIDRLQRQRHFNHLFAVSHINRVDLDFLLEFTRHGASLVLILNLSDSEHIC